MGEDKFHREKRPVGHPPAFESPDQMRSAIDAYFDDCRQNNKAITHLGLSVHIGVSRRTFNEYSRKPGFDDIIAAAKELIEEQLVQKLESKDFSTAGIIFNLVNNYGWKQPAQIQHSGNIGLSHSQVPADVQAALDEHEKEIDGE